MTESEVLRLFEEIKNWGRWGPHDERGTLNHISPAKGRQAASLIESGEVIPCGRMDSTPSVMNTTPPALHMLAAGDLESQGYGIARDYLGIPPHGPGCTHLDALCHVYFDGMMYNGRPASLIRSNGAAANSITAAVGIATRGVLLDIPRLRSVPYVDPADPVRAEELLAAETQAGVMVTEGDALIVRLGRQVRRNELGVSAERINGRVHLPGLHPDCLRWLHERGVALLVSDAGQDALPSPYTVARAPIHIGALVFMGLYLLDNAEVEYLTQACVRSERWEFFFTVSPLPMQGATGSPVNPLAIL